MSVGYFDGDPPEDDSREFVDDFWIRCPHCGEKQSAYEDGAATDDGENLVPCDSCGEDFTVRTMVSYAFVSPPLNATLKSVDDE